MGKLLHDERLEGVDPRLTAVITAAVKKVKFDCTVSEGVRTAEQAMVNFGKGRSAQVLAQHGVPARFAKPAEPKVTWVSDPMATKHLPHHGVCRAVDIYPLLGPGKIADTSKAGLALFDELYHAVMAAAAAAKTRVRYGGDWDSDGNLREKGESDSPHFELS